MAGLPSSINNSTLSDDSLFALKLDTKQRFDSILNSGQDPIAYPIPELKPEVAKTNQYDLLNPDMTNGSLIDSLFSSDKKIAEFAAQRLRSTLGSGPTSKGIGVPEFIPYDKSQDKYIKGDFGYNPYISNEDNEAFNYQYDYMEHTFAGRALRNIGTGLGRFGVGLGAKVVQTLGHMGSMVWNGVEELIDSKGNNAMVDVADNTLSRWAEHWEEDAKNSPLLSVFKPRDWEDKGFFEKLGHGAFWTDEVADGAAFMGEMILTTYGLGALGKLAGLGKFGAVPINMASKLGKFGKVMDTGTKFITGADDIAGIGRWAFNTASESAFEAAGAYKAKKDELIQQRRQGGNNLTDAQIESIAGDVAAASYKGNMLVLAASNAFENRFIFNPLFGKAVRNTNPISRLIDVKGFDEGLDNALSVVRRESTYKNKVGKFLNWKDPNSRLRFYGPRALSAIGMEGFWEENAQLAVERLSSTDSLSFGNFFKQYSAQTEAALRGDDPEASTSIGLGAIIGVGGVGGVSKATNERRKIDNAARETAENLNNLMNKYRTQFLSFQDVYKRDKDGKIEKDEYGNMQIDEDKALAVMQGIDRFVSKQDAIDKIADPLMKKFFQDDAFGDYLYAAKKAGIFDKVVRRFDGLGKMKAEDLVELGFDPNTTVDTARMRDTLAEYSKIYEEVENDKVVFPEGKEDVNELRKQRLYKIKTKVHSAKQLATEYQLAFMDRELPSVFSQEAQAYLPEIQEYNGLVRQERALEAWAAVVSEHGDFFKEHIDSERTKIQNRKNELRETFKDSIGSVTFPANPQMLRGKKLEDAKKIAEITRNKPLAENPFGIIMPNKAVDADQIFQDTDKTAKNEDSMFPDMRPEIEGVSYLDQNEIDQSKYAEMQNTASQLDFLANKLSDHQNGFKNHEDYLQYIESIQKKDAEEEEKRKAAQQTVPEKPKEVVVEEEEEEDEDEESITEILDTLNKVFSEEFAAYKNVDLDESILPEAINPYLQKHREAITNFFLTKIREIGEPVKQKMEDGSFQEQDAEELTELVGYIQKLDEAGLDEQISDVIATYLDEIVELKEEFDLREQVPTSEIELHKKLGREKANEARKLVEEWLDNDLIPDAYVDMATKTPLGFLLFVSSQSQNVAEDLKTPLNGNVAEATMNLFGETIVNYAKELFPAEVQPEEEVVIKPFDIVKTPSQEVIDELNKFSTFQEKLNYLKQAGILQPITVNGKSYDVVDYEDRVMVLMKIGQYNIPFYISTGKAGKKNVQAGNWYVVFGIGTEGWINKGTEEQINNQYNFPVFQKLSKILNEGIGRIAVREPVGQEDPWYASGKLKEGVGFLGNERQEIEEFNKQMNLPITPARNHTEAKVFYDNVKTVLELLNEELKRLGAPSTPDVIDDNEWNNFVDKNQVSKDRLTSIAKKVIARESLSPRETAIFQGKTSEIEAIIKELTTPKETNEEKMARIASLLANAPLGPWMWNLEPEDKEFYKKNRQEIDNLVRGILNKNKPPQPPENSETEAIASNNELDTMVDQAKRDGKFTFVQDVPMEIVPEGKVNYVTEFRRTAAKIINGAIQLRTAVGDQVEQALRQHNVLKRYSNLQESLNFYSEEDGKPKFKVRLMLRNEALQTPWLFWNKKGLLDGDGKPYGFPPVIAVITDGDGKILHFDLDGNITTVSNGQPVAFEYSVTEYKKWNIEKTRKTVMTPYSTEMLTHGYENDDPTNDIYEALKLGIEIFGNIDLVTAGQLSTFGSINSAGNYAKTKTPVMRTVQEMIDQGDITEDSDYFLFKQGEYLELSSDVSQGNQVQHVKKGQLYLRDEKSGLLIPLRGKKISELTVDGQPFINEQIRNILTELHKPGGSIDIENGQDPETLVSILKFLKLLFYSQDVSFGISPDGMSLRAYDNRPDQKVPLLDYEINVNYDYLQQGTTITRPRIDENVEEEDYNYTQFVKENFVSGAIPVVLSNNGGQEVRQFEKLNKRITFTLDFNHKDVLAAIEKVKSKKPPVVVPETDHSQFVGKTYKDQKGNTMEILEFDNKKGDYVYKDQKGTIKRTSKHAFAKKFPTLEQVVVTPPSEEVKQDMMDKSASLTKEEKDALMEQSKTMTEKDLEDNITFEDCE